MPVFGIEPTGSLLRAGETATHYGNTWREMVHSLAGICLVRCPHGHADDVYRVRRDGWGGHEVGHRQLFRCIAATGEAHRFLGPLAAEP